MEGLVKFKRGDGNVEIRSLPEPEPRPDEVKIKVRAAGICGSDLHIYHDHIKIPIRVPVVMGHEFSGVIEKPGSSVKDLEKGERVTSETTASSCGKCIYCGNGNYNLCPERRIIGYWVDGAFADYCVVPAKMVHRLPDNVDFTGGALGEPLACCVHAVSELTGISAGDSILITGPGAIGLLCLQIVKAEGGIAIVCGTDNDKKRLEVARKLGADYVVNIQKESLPEIVNELTENRGVDVVLECSGSPAAVGMAFDSVRKQGKYTQVGLFGRPVEMDFEKVAYKELKVTGSLGQKRSAWEKGLQLMARGKISTEKLVTDIFPIKEWRQAFAKAESRSGLKIILQPGSIFKTKT